jgi:hypothetical protein
MPSVRVAPYRQIALEIAGRLFASRAGRDPLAPWDEEVIVPSRGMADAIAAELLALMPDGVAGLRLQSLEELRRYMFDNMYLTPAVRNEFEKAQKMLIALFEYVTAHPQEFFDGTSDEPVDRLALDFLAGMTDRYAMNLYAKLFLPRPWN